MPDGIVKNKSSLVWRLTAQLVLLVALGILLMAGLGYWKLIRDAEENSDIRIEHAASVILAVSEVSNSEVVVGDDGQPVALVLSTNGNEDQAQVQPSFDVFLEEPGLAIRRGANIFRFNPQNGEFDRLAAAFRNPNGSRPHPTALTSAHPAYANLTGGQAFVGEVPVEGHERMAYFVPVLTVDGTLVGAVGVDVGWADHQNEARSNLQSILFGLAAILLPLVAALGVLLVNREMAPLRKLASIANNVATGKQQKHLPYLDRHDEVGALAQGLSRVINLQEQMKKLAYSDSLTGCGNRARYFADLEHAVVQTQRGGSRWAVVHFDLKRFSQLNDVYGQKIGDSVLRFLANEIRKVLGSGAHVSRLTADNFCALASWPEIDNRLEDLCNRLIVRVGAPLMFADCELHLDCRVGIAWLPVEGKDAETVHRNAGLALVQAKSQSHAPCVTFSQHLLDAAQHQIKLEAILHQGLERGQFYLVYQPQICPQTGRLLGLEALARWQHPEEGAIGPEIFIPVAEKTGLIVELGNWVLNESCRQARLWLDAGLEFGHVSINVSPVQLWQPNFVARVEACLKRYNLSGGNLCIEVTESIFIADDESRIAKILGQFRDMNILVSLDDFGSGYSSLSYLGRLPFNQLKIDRFFVSGADRNIEKSKLLSGIVGLGKGLGLSIVAEGAEMPGETALLARLGCDAIQGFYFSKPVPASELAFALAAIEGMAFPASGRNGLAKSA